MTVVPPVIPPPDSPPDGAPAAAAARSGAGREMPYSPEAEITVLGSMMLSRRAVTDAQRHIGVDDFYRGAHRTIYEAICQVADTGSTPDQLLVADELDRRGQLGDVGGLVAIADIVAQVPSPTQVVHYARIVARMAARRRIIDHAAAVMRSAYDPSCDPAALANSAGEQLLYDLATTADDWPVYVDDEIDRIPPPRWIVDGVVPEGLVWMYGESGAGKSFVALDLVLCTLHGLPWAARQTSSRRVVWVAGEGGPGTSARRRAWIAANLGSRPTSRHGGFILVNTAIDLRNGDDAGRLARIIETHTAGLVVLDTFERTTSGDPISTEVAAEYVRACDRIRQRTGASVLVIDHQGKDATKGIKGAHSKRGVADAVIRIAKPHPSEVNTIQMSCTKMKDAAEFADIWFRLEAHGPSMVVTHQPVAPKNPGGAGPAAVESL